MVPEEDSRVGPIYLISRNNLVLISEKAPKKAPVVALVALFAASVARRISDFSLTQRRNRSAIGTVITRTSAAQIARRYRRAG